MQQGPVACQGTGRHRDSPWAHLTIPASSRAAKGHRGSSNPGIRHLPGDSDRLQMGWDMGVWMNSAWDGPYLGRAGQGRTVGELETGPSAASLEQGLMLLENEMGSWGMHRVRGSSPPGGQGQADPPQTFSAQTHLNASG